MVGDKKKTVGILLDRLAKLPFVIYPRGMANRNLLTQL